jgi:DNA polymerase-3 subunit delta'
MAKPQLVLHTRTRQQLEQQKHHAAHALLLTGVDGIGKGAIARYIAADMLELRDSSAVDIAHQVALITPDEKQTISIESIRQLQHFLKLKTTGRRAIRRVIILEHAQALTPEAQNALLKILEEPPADTTLILTAQNQQSLLPTIMSRVQTISVMEPSKEQLLEFFDEYAPSAVIQAFFLSGGLPGLMKALLDEDAEHPLVQSVSRAKTLLQNDLFNRLAVVDQMSKQRTDAIQLCGALHRIARTALEQAAVKGDVRRISQWQRIVKAATEAQDLLTANVNTKLTLTQLMLHLSS